MQFVGLGVGCSKCQLALCRRESVRDHKQVQAPVAVRRSRRQVRPTSRLGVFEDSQEMEAPESSDYTKTTGNFSPGESFVCVW